MTPTETPTAPTPPRAKCATCPQFTTSNLQRMGVSAGDSDHIVALLGNPNTGKSTVFNALTGLRQHVGNWPGKTVARAEGGFKLHECLYKIVDLPGTYSLFSSSHHEEIARDFVLFGQPDVTVVVVDATRLERNLILVLQTLEITSNVVVALNLMDEAKRHGIDIDVRHLSKRLGVQVVPMAARRGEGIKELLEAIHAVAKGVFPAKPHRVNHRADQLETAVGALVPALESSFPGLPNARWVALRLLDADHSIIEAIEDGSLGDIEQMTLNVMPNLKEVG